jgi:D-alanyl-D-alanine carboxypeptidase
MTGWAGHGRLALTLLMLATLAACSGGTRTASTGAQYGYTPPGPPEDPWGPYITEAANRFSVPGRWIRAVMHQESGGHEYLNGQPITSDAGATGLMQIMPATYAELRDQYNLGSDPYNPHDNIIAGTGYIRQMYDRFGSPAFLAAYNAGPQRVQDYMAGRGGLPNETVNYLASIAPRLGHDLPMTGPLMAYADNGGAALTPDPVPHAYARRPIARCWQDPDAAYDPDAPCRAAPPMRLAAAPPPPMQHYAAVSRPAGMIPTLPTTPIRPARRHRWKSPRLRCLLPLLNTHRHRARCPGRHSGVARRGCRRRRCRLITVSPAT